MALQGCTSYVTNCDIFTAGYQTNLPGAGTCTSICTVSATLSLGGSHPILYGCKILWWWNERGICAFDIDHMTASFLTSSTAGTGYGMGILLACFGPYDYSTSTQAWTVGTCNYNGTRTTTTISAGNHITSNNSASVVSPGIPSGQGSATNCSNVSPYLLPNPSSTPSPFVPFICDWSASQDPSVTGNGYPVAQGLDVTNLPNGNLFVVIEQKPSSGANNLYGCTFDITTSDDDGCEQITTDTLAASGDVFGVNVYTGPSGTIYLIIITGSTSAHSCGTVACEIEYEAPLTFGNTPIFSFEKSVSFGGSASAGVPGGCPADQMGGYHALCTQLWGTFSSSANTTSLAGYDWTMP